MSWMQSLTLRIGIIGELLRFFWHNKWWWLIPMLMALLALCGLLILAQSSAISPFIYTLF